MPLQRLDTLKIAAVSIGRTNITGFQRSVGRYAGIKNYYIDDKATSASIDQTMLQLKNYNLVIAAVNGLGIMASSDYKLTNAQIEAAKKITRSGKTIVVIFGNPYVLKSLEGIEKAFGIIEVYQENYDTQDLVGQLIFGAFAPEGKLPVTVNSGFNRGDGLVSEPSGRFKFTLSDELGVDSLTMKKKIDEVINTGLEEKAFPGCQVFLAKNGKVFFHQSYGFHTYEKERPVECDDLYDLASVTKISAPLPALMYLADQKKFSVNKQVSEYWPDWKGSNKQYIKVADLLSHQARLRPGIIFWKKAMDENGQLNPDFFSAVQSERYPVRVSKNLCIVDSYANYMYTEIRNSPLLKQKKYVYSDLGFIILPKIIESLTKQNYETFVKEKFYNPLGASTLTFNPYLYFPIEKIVPTENDQIFRHELLQGFVQDESAAMLGGISGNAGLFGTIGDMAKLMQMYLQYGQYGGERYISDATMKEWTKRHFTQLNNRRAYGFDKPSIGNQFNEPENGYPSPLVSDASFGHSGYTGTFVWADSVSGILLLFFSNRVCPSRENNTLAKLKLRVLLQQTVYEVFNAVKSETTE
jgi:CubicO group peptidase (beta-lactamase class C family)